MFDSLDNKIIITGHTDAMAYKNNIYNNWNLSGDRALSARRVLEEAGMPEDTPGHADCRQCECSDGRSAYHGNH